MYNDRSISSSGGIGSLGDMLRGNLSMLSWDLTLRGLRRIEVDIGNSRGKAVSGLLHLDLTWLSRLRDLNMRWWRQRSELRLSLLIGSLGERRIVVAAER